jgi:hypothetical protein
MPLAPLTVSLSDGQKQAALKRMQKHYSEALTALEAELTEALTASAEADLLAQYLGEQPEVKDLRALGSKSAELEKRRQYLGAILERLAAVIPVQPDVHAPLPNAKPAGVRKY